MDNLTDKPDGRCIHCRTDVKGRRINHPKDPTKKITVYDCPNCGELRQVDVELYMYPSRR